MGRSTTVAAARREVLQTSRLQHRRQAGSLSSRLVTPRILTYYNNACKWFFLLLQSWQLSISEDVSALEENICDVIEFAWETGDHRGRIGNLLSGLEHHCTFLRGNLRSCWRLWRVWGNSEIPCRAPPLTVEATMGMAGYMWMWGFRSAAVLTCLGFHCFLRSMEFMCIQCKQFIVSSNGKRCHIALPRTKGTSRHGGVEGVNVEDPILVKLLRSFTAQRQPGDFILDLTPADYRAVFAAAVLAIGLPSTFKPYSLRRGGATWHFRMHGSISLTMEIGGLEKLPNCPHLCEYCSDGVN